MKHTKQIASFLLFIGIFFIGALTANKSWNGRTYVNLNDINGGTGSRDPAAIKKVFDFSHLDGGALEFASKNRLLEGSKIVQKSGEIGIELGHYVTRADDGRKVFACQSYDKVMMVFEADGSAVNGERPTMLVEANCQIASDVNRISAIWIPYSTITKEKPGEYELSFKGENPVNIQFRNVLDEWPHQWSLVDVALKDPGGHEVHVDRFEIRKLMGKVISLNWSNK